MSRPGPCVWPGSPSVQGSPEPSSGCGLCVTCRSPGRGARLAWAPEHRKLTLPLVVLSIVSTLATAASPWLLQTPFLLALLTPRMAFLALAAPVTPLPIFVVLGTVRLCVADVASTVLFFVAVHAGACLF